MTVAENVRSLAKAARPAIRAWLDAAAELKEIRQAASDKGIDWTALKALLVAQERDADDGGDRLHKLLKKLDISTEYADMIVSEKQKASPQSNPAPVVPHTDREAEADAVSQETHPPAGASATDSVSFEAAASESSVRSPDLNESRGGVESRHASLVRSATSGTRESECDAERPAPESTGHGVGVQADDSPKKCAFDTAMTKSEKLSVKAPQAGVAPGPRDTKQETGEGRSADSTLHCAPLAAAGATAAGDDDSESEPVEVAAPIRSGGVDPDRETGFHAGSPPLSVDPLSIPATLRREPNNGVWS